MAEAAMAELATKMPLRLLGGLEAGERAPSNQTESRAMRKIKEVEEEERMCITGSKSCDSR
jgi:hypothetical protein